MKEHKLPGSVLASIKKKFSEHTDGVPINKKKRKVNTNIEILELGI